MMGKPDIRFQRANSSIKILATQEMHAKFAMECHTFLISVKRYYDNQRVKCED
jgi:hypothetical protein